jgi:hypothetical protein
VVARLRPVQVSEIFLLLILRNWNQIDRITGLESWVRSNPPADMSAAERFTTDLMLL